MAVLSVEVEVGHLVFGEPEVVRQLVVQRSRDLSFEFALVTRETLQVALENQDPWGGLDPAGREHALGPSGTDEQPEQFRVERGCLVGQDVLGGQIFDHDGDLVEATSELLGEHRPGADDHPFHGFVRESYG